MIAKSVIHHFVYDPMNLKIAEIKMRCYTNFIVGKKPEEAKVNEFKDFWESDEDVQKNIKEEKKEEMADIQEIEKFIGAINNNSTKKRSIASYTVYIDE